MDRGENELFLRACGLTGPMHLHLEGRGGLERLVFERPFAVVGRDPGADLVIDHPSVSRRHAYFQSVVGRVFCVDLGSRTGIHWGQGPDHSGWVDGRQGVRLGDFRILAGDDADADADDDAGPVDGGDPLSARYLDDSPLSLPEVTLILSHESGPLAWRVGRVLTLVGRSSVCRLRLLDPSVSKFHCSLLRTPGGVWAIDLLGRGGIKHNGRRVRWARLGPDDQLRVGRYLIEVRCEMTLGDPSASGIMAVGEPSVADPRQAWPAPLPAPKGDGGRTPALRSSPSARPSAPAVVTPPSGELIHAKAEQVEPLMAQMAHQFGQMQQQMFDQLGQMQQQMFDQFQQVTMSMAEMFGALHRDQMALVRDELDRLRRLDQDLRALQSELEANAGASAPPPAIPAPARAPAPGEAPAAGAPAQIESMPRASRPRPVGDAAVKLGTAGAEADDPGVPTSSGWPAGSSPGPTDQQPSDLLPDEDIHSLLSRRIATLQRERQGRWQRVLELMLGR